MIFWYRSLTTSSFPIFTTISMRTCCFNKQSGRQKGTHLENKQCRLPSLHTCNIQCLPRRLIALWCAHFHSLENRCVQHNPMNTVCTHNEPRLALQRLFRARCPSSVDLECADASLFPLFAFEVVELCSTRKDSLLCFFARFNCGRRVSHCQHDCLPENAFDDT